MHPSWTCLHASRGSSLSLQQDKVSLDRAVFTSTSMLLLRTQRGRCGRQVRAALVLLRWGAPVAGVVRDSCCAASEKGPSAGAKSIGGATSWWCSRKQDVFSLSMNDHDVTARGGGECALRGGSNLT